MTMNPTDQFTITPEMRAFAEKNVEQARQAFENFVAVAQRTVNTFEGQAESARKGAKDLARQAMALAERNINASFDFAQKLVHAKDVQDVVQLHSDYVKDQMQALNEQAKQMSDNASRYAKEAANPH